MQTGVSQGAGSCRILQGPPLADPGLPALTRVYLQFFCFLHCSFSFPADPGLIDPGWQLPDCTRGAVRARFFILAAKSNKKQSNIMKNKVK